jgi:hypothetical protein
MLHDRVPPILRPCSARLLLHRPLTTWTYLAGRHCSSPSGMMQLRLLRAAAVAARLAVAGGSWALRPCHSQPLLKVVTSSPALISRRRPQPMLAALRAAAALLPLVASFYVSTGHGRWSPLMGRHQTPSHGPSCTRWQPSLTQVCCVFRERSSCAMSPNESVFHHLCF